jgi:Neuronal voltage-dependent calcium channel alpha 2acd
VIDNNGFVLISENMTDTGRFFGEVEKPVMESMVHANIFKQITVYDLQGLCLNITYQAYSEFSDCKECISAGSGLLTVCCRNLFGVGKSD